VLKALMEAWTGTQTVEAVVDRLEAVSVPASPILDVAQMAASPNAMHRQLVRTARHPTAGTVPVVLQPGFSVPPMDWILISLDTLVRGEHHLESGLFGGVQQLSIVQPVPSHPISWAWLTSWPGSRSRRYLVSFWSMIMRDKSPLVRVVECEHFPNHIKTVALGQPVHARDASRTGSATVRV
jgi:hypothetical protein